MSSLWILTCYQLPKTSNIAPIVFGKKGQICRHGLTQSKKAKTVILDADKTQSL